MLKFIPRVQLLLGILLVSGFFIDSVAQVFHPYFSNPIAPEGDIVWIDYDLDGDPDLVTSGVYLNGVPATILYSNENGSFVQSPEDFDNISGNLFTFDYENDGDLDLYIGYVNLLTLFKNNNGVFEKQLENFIGGKELKWLDYDNDGDTDVVVNNNGGSLFLFRNVSGNWMPEILRSNFPYSLVDVADFNSDGKNDVLVFRQHESTYGNVLDIFWGHTGFYPEGQTPFLNIYNASPYVFDYDDDGDKDVLLTGKLTESDIRTAYLYQNNNGVFAQTSGIPFFEDYYPRAQYINHDQQPEITRYNTSIDSSEFFINKENGIFQKLKNSPLLDFLWIGWIKYAGALGEDEDSYMCVVGELYTGIRTTRIYHKENGTYQDLYPNPMHGFESSPLVAWTDFNNDGLKDPYISGFTNLSSPYGGQLLKNTGSGFEHVTYFDQGKAGLGQWVDFDKDGEMDFVTVTDLTESEPQRLVLYQGFTQGVITSTVLLNNISETESYPTILDFDNDNDNDIFISGYMQGLYVNNNGTLTRSITFNAPNSYRFLSKSAWADYDKDGDQDLLMNANFGSGDTRPRIYRNNGTAFSLVTEFINLDNGYFFWLDFDQDNQLDIFMIGRTTTGASYIKLYKNNAGVFSPITTSVFSNLTDTDFYQTHAEVVDFNGDGYPDIVISGNGATAPKLSFYKNNNGAFELYTKHKIPARWDTNFSWADFDNDGDQDMLYTGRGPVSQIYVNEPADESKPVIVSLQPANNNVLVYQDGYSLSIQFNEAITKINGMLGFYRKSNQQLVYSVDISTTTVTTNGNVANIHFTDNVFDDGEELYILLDAGSFKDLSDNVADGISNVNIWNVTIQNDKLDQSITFLPFETLMINQTPPTLNASSTSGLPVQYSSSNPEVASISNRVVTLHAGGSTTITATQPGNSTYNSAAPVAQILSVSKLTQQINFNEFALTTVFSDAFSPGATTSSGLQVSYSSSNTEVATVSENMLTNFSYGTTTITATQLGNHIYEAADPVSRELEVKRLTQDITFDALPNKNDGDDPFELNGSSTSGLLVSYSSSDLLVATVSGNIVTIIGSGQTEITASQEGNQFYEPALNIIQVLTVEVVTGVEDPEMKHISLYPNPAQETLTFRGLAYGGLTQFYFYDSYGRLVKKVESNNNEQALVSLDDLENGLYIVRIMQSNKSSWKRFIKATH